MGSTQSNFANGAVMTREKEQEQRVLREKRRFARNRRWTILFFITPGLLLLLVFLIIPIFQAVWYSMYRWNGLGPMVDFQGIENYRQAFSNTVFHKALLHSLILMVLSLCLQLPFSMAVALVLVRGNLRFSGLLRAIFFVPYVFSEIITGIIWISVFSPRGGLLNWAITLFNPEHTATAYLADRNLVLLCIFLVITWKYFGFHLLLYMAGLQNVDKDVEDSARVSGAKEWQVLRWVTLPMMSNTIRLSIYLSVLGALQQFILIWVLTTGGPANASEVIVTFLYKYGIQRMQLGFGSAVAVILLGITLTFSLIYQRYVLNRDPYD